MTEVKEGVREMEKNKKNRKMKVFQLHSNMPIELLRISQFQVITATVLGKKNFQVVLTRFSTLA